jgi:ankyrin repeat protein
LAVARENMELIECLLKHLAATDLDGFLPSPLLLAAIRQRKEMIELLAKHEANVNTMWNRHHILEVMVLSKAPAVDGEELVSGEEIKLDTMRLLCKLGSDPCRYHKEIIQAKQDLYRPAFYVALQERDLRAFTLFCEYAQNIESIEGDHSETLLHMVILAGSHSEAETKLLETMTTMLLTDTSSYVNSETEDGDTALHIAASLGKIETVKILVDAGADVHVKNLDSLTPFMVAIIFNQFEVASYLVTKGAMPNSRTNSNKTVLHLLYNEHDLQRLNPLNEPSPTDRLHLTRSCIEKLKVNPNLTDDSNKTARDYAIHYELVKFYPQSVNYHHQA